MERNAINTLLAACIGFACCVGPVFGQADPNKVLRISFSVAETGFDPQATNDIYSTYLDRAIFEPLYGYDHLARPMKLIPNTAAALPEVSSNGTVWTMRVKPGTYFTDDPAFKGVKRELTAHDYVYSWKRLLDPKTRSPNVDIFNGKIVGMDAVIEKAKETGKFDYDAVVPGLQAIDRYTIKMTLNYPSFDLLSNLTNNATAAVAREVIEAYGDGNGWAMANPVGTGPYRLKEWRRGQKIVLEANPDYRDVRYPVSSDPADAAIMARLKGKKVPLIGRIEISIIEESNPRLLAFEKGDLDYVTVPGDLVWNVLERDNKLKAKFAKAGVILGRGIQPAITYAFFNMDDPIVGGYTKEKVALRRAIGMAYSVEEEIRVLRQDQGQPATQLIPPGVYGHDPKFAGNIKFDPAGAKALLDKFGYVDRDKDGWRDLPDGKPLVLKMGATPTAVDRQFSELWQRNLAAVGIKIEFVNQKWPELLKMARNGQLQMWQLGGIATRPEPYEYVVNLYGKNSGDANLARFKLAEFDKLYEQGLRLPEGPEKFKVLHDMSALVGAYSPFLLNAYRYENVIVYPWVIGYKYNGFNWHPWQYFDIDLKMKRTPVE